MKKLSLSISFIFICVISLSASQPSLVKSPILWDFARLKSIRNIVATDPKYKASFEALIREADRSLLKANMSVMDKPMTPASGSKHDYMSLLRYCWPNPETKDGLPYVYRDGITNPEISIYDHDNLNDLAITVRNLTLAYYFTSDKRYSQKAVKMIRTWFLDQATRVNPNMNHSQVIPGLYKGIGRPSGMVDSYFYVKMLDAALLLEQCGVIPASDMQGLRTWFKGLTNWLQTNPIAKTIDKDIDNKAVLYDVQIVSFALFYGGDSLARAVIDSFPAKRIAHQVAADGSQPNELRRTRPLNYTLYNMEHMIDMCDMAKVLGIDIYNSQNDAIDRSFTYIIPLLSGEDRSAYGVAGSITQAVRGFAQLIYRASAYDNMDYYRGVYEKYKSPQEDYIFTLLYKN